MECRNGLNLASTIATGVPEHPWSHTSRSSYGGAHGIDFERNSLSLQRKNVKKAASIVTMLAGVRFL